VAIDATLADLVEAARLDEPRGGRPGMTLADFITHVGRNVKLRHALVARQAFHSGAAMPARSPAADVLDLARSVRRWAGAEEFRGERARALGRIRAELDRVEAGLASLCRDARAGSDMVISRPAPVDGVYPPDDPHRTGLTHIHDEFLRRSYKLLTQREALSARLARLDATGDAGRGAAVRDAIERAGGTLDLVEVLAPSMPCHAADELARVRAAAESVTRQLTQIDPATRKAAGLIDRRGELDAQALALEGTAGRQRTSAAAVLVAGALCGGLAAVQALETAARADLPELAATLNRVRAGDAELEVVVAEMIGA
jgi:hypothetical protein